MFLTELCFHRSCACNCSCCWPKMMQMLSCRRAKLQRKDNTGSQTCLFTRCKSGTVTTRSSATSSLSCSSHLPRECRSHRRFIWTAQDRYSRQEKAQGKRKTLASVTKTPCVEIQARLHTKERRHFHLLEAPRLPVTAQLARFILQPRRCRHFTWRSHRHTHRTCVFRSLAHQLLRSSKAAAQGSSAPPSLLPWTMTNSVVVELQMQKSFDQTDSSSRRSMRKPTII